MIKSFMDLTREEVENLGKIGFFKNSVQHYDVCKALAEGKTQAQVAEKFNIEDHTVRYIKRQKCPDCGLSKGHPPKSLNS